MTLEQRPGDNYFETRTTIEESPISIDSIKPSTGFDNWQDELAAENEARIRIDKGAQPLSLEKYKQRKLQHALEDQTPATKTDWKDRLPGFIRNLF
jgi:hypothetical protein